MFDSWDVYLDSYADSFATQGYETELIAFYSPSVDTTIRAIPAETKSLKCSCFFSPCDKATVVHYTTSIDVLCTYNEETKVLAFSTNQLCSGITRSGEVSGELYAQRFQKLFRNLSVFICLVQVWLRTEVPCSPSLARSGLELMTSRSWQYISCHWDKML